MGLESLETFTDRQLVEQATLQADALLSNSTIGFAFEEGTILVAGLTYKTPEGEGEQSSWWSISRRRVPGREPLYACGAINAYWQTADLSHGTWWSPQAHKIDAFQNVWGRTKLVGYSPALARTTVQVLQHAEVFDPRCIS